MTGNEFNAEYKLGQRIASSSVESYLAHVTATRRLVMVHRMAGANDGERRRIGAGPRNRSQLTPGGTALSASLPIAKRRLKQSPLAI